MKKYPQLHESFYHEIFILEQNLRNHKSFLPRKFGAIGYYRKSIYAFLIVFFGGFGLDVKPYLTQTLRLALKFYKDKFSLLVQKYKKQLFGLLPA